MPITRTQGLLMTLTLKGMLERAGVRVAKGKGASREGAKARKKGFVGTQESSLTEGVE